VTRTRQAGQYENNVGAGEKQRGPYREPAVGGWTAPECCKVRHIGLCTPIRDGWRQTDLAKTRDCIHCTS
jgi:hypothetical protein